MIAVLVVAWLLAPRSAVNAAAFIPSGAGAAHWAAGLLRLPLLAFQHEFSDGSRSGNAPPEQRLEASLGWRTIGFATHVSARGCFLRVQGRIEFDRAQVLFADGDLRELELRSARRGNGIYELTSWDEPRDVVCVRLRARACSDEARCELLLRD